MSEDQRDTTDGGQRDDATDGPGQAQATRTGLPRWLRVLLLVLVIAVSVVVLFTWVFPWVESMTQDPTLGAQLLRLPR